MDFLLPFLLGGLLVFLIAVLRYPNKQKTSGTFIIDFSDPMTDVCKLELSEDLNVIYQKKQIVLNVEIYDDYSHK